MANISRNEGYKKAEGKEEQGITAVLGFLKECYGADAERITEAEENYRHGDLRIESNTIEVKSQPIDPQRYKKIC